MATTLEILCWCFKPGIESPWKYDSLPKKRSQGAPESAWPAVGRTENSCSAHYAGRGWTDPKNQQSTSTSECKQTRALDAHWSLATKHYIQYVLADQGSSNSTQWYFTLV